MYNKNKKFSSHGSYKQTPLDQAAYAFRLLSGLLKNISSITKFVTGILR